MKQWISSLPLLTTLLLGNLAPSFAEIPAATLRVMPPMNQIYHPVSTSNPEAQKNFDLGLTYIFAFNHDLALAYFEKAAELDPNLAMAYWGKALARGQNVNSDVTPERELKCYEWIQQALKLAPQASSNEQAYITALATRYTNDPKADLIPFRFAYREAMKKVTKDYPEDLDAATLYSESLLDLYPWKWWSIDFKPADGTFEAMDTLESVLARNPAHIGANHYYIHAVEESPYPERGLLSAYRLMTLLPNAGHLLHMPCHIFMLTGNYEAAVRTSKNAIAADRDYIKKQGVIGYPLHYLSHNLHILARIYMLQEDSVNAIKTAMELNQFLEPYFKDDLHLSHFSQVPLEIYLYFHQWKEILGFTPLSPAASTQAFWHYSRAVAFASLGDLDSALKEKELMIQQKQLITSEERFSGNPATRIIDFAEVLLNATLDKVQNKIPEYMEGLNKAVALQDQFDYDEPPAWNIPIRQTLGAALIEQGKFAEAEDAFRRSMRSLKRNGRSLFGLSLALKGQGKTIDAFWVERQMTEALKHATQKLELKDL